MSLRPQPPPTLQESGRLRDSLGHTPIQVCMGVCVCVCMIMSVEGAAHYTSAMSVYACACVLWTHRFYR